MKTGLRGPLPETLADFEQLVAERKARFATCFDCKEPFSDKNVLTPLGWRETQISDMCEVCFNNLFSGNQHAN